MNLVADSGGVLRVTGLDHLGAANCGEFKQQVVSTLTDTIRVVELDCGALRYIDSDGFGSLINLHKRLGADFGCVRLLQPSPALRELLRLLRFNEIFELTP
ncbi:MAG: STAS domain-containing protein [Verrucomicrobiota bacterium]